MAFRIHERHPWIRNKVSLRSAKTYVGPGVIHTGKARPRLNSRFGSKDPADELHLPKSEQQWRHATGDHLDSIIGWMTVGRSVRPLTSFFPVDFLRSDQPVDFWETSAPKTARVFLQKHAYSFDSPLASQWNPSKTN